MGSGDGEIDGERDKEKRISKERSDDICVSDGGVILGVFGVFERFVALRSSSLSDAFEHPVGGDRKLFVERSEQQQISQQQISLLVSLLASFLTSLLISTHLPSLQQVSRKISPRCR